MRYEDRKRRIGTVLLLSVFAICFVLIIWWMYSVGLIVLPPSLVKLLGIDDTPEDDILPWDTGELYSMLKDGFDSPPEGVTFELGYENLRAALISEPEPIGYYQNARITYYSSGEAKSRRTLLYKNGESFRIERYSDDSDDTRYELVIADAESLKIRDMLADEEHTLPRSDDISAEHEAGFPSVDELLAIVAQFPETKSMPNSVAEESEPRYIDTTVAMTESNGSNVYYVAYTDSTLGTREEYYLSLTYRVIIAHHTYYGNELIYSFETVGFSADEKDYADSKLYNK